MKASVLLKGARRGAGLSQRDLARRSRIPQASISRIERGIVSPSVDTLDRLLRHCGREVEAVPRPGDGVDRTLIQERLRMTPGQRARQAVVEWDGTRVFRDAGRRNRSRVHSTHSVPSESS